MSIHHFDTEVAAEVGLAAAVLAYSINYWCEHKRANNRDIKDGKAWVYNSAKAWAELNPYLTEKQVRTALNKLEKAGIIDVRNLNQKQYDQTRWYAYNGVQTVIDTANCPNGKMQFTKKENAIYQMGSSNLPNGQTYTNNIHYNIPDTNVSVARDELEIDLIPEPPPSKPKRKPAPRGAARGSRIDPNWMPSPADYAFAAKHNFTREEINHEADQFRDYWIAASGRNAAKLDWSATWRNRIRDQAKYRGERAARSSGSSNTKGQPGGGGLLAAGLRHIGEARGYGKQVS